MKDGRILLDGTWDFLHIADDRASGPARVRKITVPGVWQAQFDDLRSRIGIGLYTRMVELDPDWIRAAVRLHFGASFYNTRVWVNQQFVGDHQGGFLPFSFDVTRYLRPGKNEITVRADSPADDPEEFPDAPLAEIPFGKQSWYGPWSGIWQSVWLERRIPDHIAAVRLRPELASGRVGAEVFFRAPTAERSTLLLRVLDPAGHAALEQRIEVPAGATDTSLEATVESVRAWSPAEPNLYLAEFVLERDGRAIDEFAERFGFRTIEVRHGRFYLNGELLYLRGALDQDYYPDTIATPPSAGFIRDQLLKAKELGLNCIRMHIKAPDPSYYEIADEIGILIWAELPNGGLSTPKSRARKEALLKGIVDRDGNHPCIIIWTIINENWGVDLVHDADHRAWLRQTYAWLKSYDPLRLVVDNSPLDPSFHVETDIADYHFYAAIPDNRHKWDDFVEQVAHRPNWLFSPAGDAVVTGNEPLMISEFGNWGLPYPQDLVGPDGREPWWFETGHDWGEGVMYPHGIENRFLDWSMDRVFGNLDAFIKAAQWQQFRALKYQIETMRRHPQLAGYVITELTDVHWEANGLLDIRRNPRQFHQVFHTINADIVIAPRSERFSYWAGETAHLDIAVANASPQTIAGATLEIAHDGHAKTMPLPSLEPGVVLNLGWTDAPVPHTAVPTMLRWTMTLRRGDGAPIATNTFDMAVHPRRAASAVKERLWSPDPSIRSRLELLGYALAEEMESADMIVSTKHDDKIAAAVRNGARALLLPETEGTLYPFFPHWQKVRVVERDSRSWQGDWASSFAWLRRNGAYKSMPGGLLLDETFDRVLPTHVIAGCNLLDFQSRVHAGLVVGWIHKPVALVVERPYGRGRIVASTLRLLRDPVGVDPTATQLLDASIALALREVAVSAETPPTLEAPALVGGFAAL